MEVVVSARLCLAIYWVLLIYRPTIYTNARIVANALCLLDWTVMTWSAERLKFVEIKLVGIAFMRMQMVHNV